MARWPDVAAGRAPTRLVAVAGLPALDAGGRLLGWGLWWILEDKTSLYLLHLWLNNNIVNVPNILSFFHKYDL